MKKSHVRWSVVMLMAVAAGLAALSMRDGRVGFLSAPRSDQASTAIAADARSTATKANREDAASARARRESALLVAAVNRHWERLARDGTPRQQVLALRMLVLGARAGDVALRRRAQRTAAALLADTPEDEVLAVAQTWFCDPLPADCTEEATGAWARVAPDNSAAWMQPVRAAGNNTAAIDAALARASEAARYDSLANALALEAAAGAESIRLPPLGEHERRSLLADGYGTSNAERRRLYSTATIFALSLPPLGAVSRNCAGPLSASRAAACRRLARTMLTGANTLIEKHVALAMLAKLYAGTADATHWESERRRLRWWMGRFSVMSPGPQYWQEYLEFGEFEAVRRALLRAHVPLDPPAGWRGP